MRGIVLLMGLLMVTVPASALVAPPAAAATLHALTPTWARSLAADPASGFAVARAVLRDTTQQSPTAALQATYAAQGLDLGARLAALDVAAGEVPPGVPDGLRVSVGRRLGAITVAEQLRVAALADLTPEERTAALAGFIHGEAAIGQVGAAANGQPFSYGAGAQHIVLDSRAAAIAAKVKLPDLALASLVIVRAIEQGTPELRAFAAARSAGSLLPGPAPAAAGPCDITGAVLFSDATCSNLVIGDVQPNTYGPLVNPLLLLDVGGDDAYNGPSAVGASSVRVVVDVAGNDRYERSAAFSGAGVGGFVYAQGVGNLGVGVLADLAGNDRYAATIAATSPEPGPLPGQVTAVAQGVGSLGAGVLLDAGGQDVFSIEARNTGNFSLVQGQGMGFVGAGALLNLGATDAALGLAGPDDSYHALANSTVHYLGVVNNVHQYQIGATEVDAQGAGLLAGAGALVDAGGSDAYDATAEGGTASATAQGAGTGTTNGALLGIAGGVGLLIDGAGDDTMTTIATGKTALSIVTADPSFCWDAFTNVTTGETRAVGQGGGNVGAGALIDGSGNDARAIRTESRAEAFTSSTSNFNCPSFGFVNRAKATARDGPAEAQGQGSGILGAGLLVDLTGNDVNRLEARSSAFAKAVATSPGANELIASASTSSTLTQGQGHALTGLGLLADAQGNDQYESLVSSTATVVLGTANGAGVVGPQQQQVQGYGDGLTLALGGRTVGTGLGFLVEVDGADAYSTSPAQPGPANLACWTRGTTGRGMDWSNAAGSLPTLCT